MKCPPLLNLSTTTIMIVFLVDCERFMMKFIVNSYQTVDIDGGRTNMCRLEFEDLAT